MAHKKEVHGGERLRRWLEENEVQQYRLAAHLKRTPQYVSRIIAGGIEPSLHKAVEIERFTKGAVPAASLILPERLLDMAS